MMDCGIGKARSPLARHGVMKCRHARKRKAKLGIRRRQLLWKEIGQAASLTLRTESKSK
jgi:hypothetical protein